MLKEKLKNYQIILASGSPRRQQLFKDLGLDFKVIVKPVDEVYPERLKKSEISDYLAQLKSLPFKDSLKDNELVVTSDTIVWHNNQALGKPTSREHAIQMLQSLSNTTHQVITSVCFTTKKLQKTVNATTNVTFKELTTDEITFYVDTYKPFDKAGAYGIQEWIGFVGVSKIEGSYFNVMGLPLHLVYKTLMSMVTP